MTGETGPPGERTEGDETGAQKTPVVRPAAGAVARPSGRKPAKKKEELPSMSLLEHLEELRTRLLWCFGALLAAFFVCWWQSEAIFRFLARPVYRYLPKGQKLVVLAVTDSFMLYVKVALLAALFIAAPVILYHVWRFIRPGLYSRERYYALGFIVSGTLLFTAGGAFAYYVAFPFAVEFLLGVGRDFTPSITGPSYLSFLMTVIVGLALMFELPLVIVFLARMGVVTPRFLMRNFRWAVLIIFIVAAIITPTSDVFNLCLFALPTLGLYLLGVGAAAIVGRAQARARAREEEEDSEEEEGEAAWS